MCIRDREQPAAAPSPSMSFGGFNPNAPAFSFNPSASTFVLPVSEPAPEPPTPAEDDPVAEVTSEAVALSLGGDDPVEPVPEPEPAPAEEARAPKKTLAEIEAEDLAELAELEAAEVAAESAKKEPIKITAAERLTAKNESLAAAAAEAVAAAVNKKKLVNLIFIGHVDAGKSTLSGHLMYLTGMLDDRTLQKFESEAKAKNRESWKFAWALDVTDQERAKGKTEECGRAFFETEQKRFVIIDAPGHKSFVPHMIGGASQADAAVLVISARRGEFETGFEKGGQTREHAMLAKTAGVKRLIVVINKMDDPTVEWAKDRYDECVTKLTPYLKNVGFKLSEIQWMPVSGLGGHNLRERLLPGVADWYEGPSLLEYLDAVSYTHLTLPTIYSV
eukprot:TRINITY_DN1669_c0_g1_i1.p1 TRINITY_DN1669_c0_g1~~TRINITY_DN1669_c0_g1_i1.p1  ORF type:complete len:390 (-),score=136.28 TRINITY_DN1669_c0_g1_i1:89-1258(-)